MFYDIVNALCKERKTSITRMAEEIGLSNAAPTSWKKGAVPKLGTLKKISEYFGVSVEYLLGEGQKKAPTLEGERAAELSPAFFRLKQGLEPYDISESDVDFLLEVYKAHIKKNL